MLLGLAALLAIPPLVLGVLGPAAQTIPGLSGSMRSPLRRYGVLAAAFTLLTNVSALAVQTAVIFPDTFFPLAMGQTLVDTRYGQLWLIRTGLLLLCAGIVIVALWGTGQWARLALVGGVITGLALPLPFSLLSHAAAQQEGRLAAVAADALHLLAASVWAGGLFMLVLVLLPAMRTLEAEERLSVLRVVLPRFSTIALTAWGILLLSGLYASWLQVGTMAALRETPYGQSLLLKGALLMPILGLAAFHLRLGQGDHRWSGARRFVVTIAAEALLVVAVMLVVGRLIGLEPAREAFASRTPSAIVIPVAFATNDGERQARFAISPGVAGTNTFTIEVDGEPVPGASQGVLRFELVDRSMGEQELLLSGIGQNRFQAVGSELTLPGNWRIEVIVREIGAFSWATEIVVPIDETPLPVPVENPAARFSAAGIPGMIAIAIGIAGLSAALVIPGGLIAPRYIIAALGAGAMAAGIVVLAGSRLPLPGPASQVVARSAVEAVASPHVVADHNGMVDHHTHGTPVMSSATPEPLPGPGTPVSEDGISVAIAAAPESAGPVTISIEVADADGSPLEDARIVVLSEMPDMAMGRMETPAMEMEPGHYVAESVPLVMTGEWRLAVRVSPRGASTQVFAFGVRVP